VRLETEASRLVLMPAGPGTSEQVLGGTEIRPRCNVIAYHLIREPLTYRDLGENYFDKLHADRTKRRLVQRRRTHPAN
jgi:hypothetical protein